MPAVNEVGVSQDPLDSVGSHSAENQKDPDTIVYDAKPVASNSTGEKAPASGKDGYTDCESAAIGNREIQRSRPTPLLKPSLQLVTKALEIDDDPTETPFTFRAFVLGLGLSAFGAVIAEIFYFKPQTINVNIIFLLIIAYCFGEATTLIPRWSPLGRFLNPGPFNQKEHVFVVIMASAASTAALGTEQLAAQSLYYNSQPNAASAIFMLISSQCLGYGLIGLIRKTFVYPTKFTWPTILPHASLFQSMHRDKALAKRRLKMFWIVCLAIMVWEIIPEYVFPLTVGVSIFCLANQHSAMFTFLFGGANGDEGLGFLSWCMDWQYITTDPLILPLNTLVNQLIGYLGCIALTIGVYYTNLWNAKTFPFMAQDLFTANGSVYDQTKIMNSNNEVQPSLLESYGLPWFSTSNALSLMLMNMGVAAGVVHTFLWDWGDLKFIFAWMTPDGIKQRLQRAKSSSSWKFWREKHVKVQYVPGTEGDPHFAAMQAYDETPNWWFHSVLTFAIIIGLICCYQQETGLPWWTFLIAVILSAFLTMVYACLFGITGFYYQPTTAIQMIGAYLVPLKPVANMMFTLYGSNGLIQGLLMLKDLKLATYGKLQPKATFIAQMIGTVVGGVLNYVMMNSIVKSQRETLLSVEGTNIWSGQNVQTYNAQAVAWGGAGDKIFGRYGEYWMVPMGLLFGVFAPLPFYFLHTYVPRLRKFRLDYLNTYIICFWLGWLSVGINSSLTPYFAFGFFTQGYLRRYRPVLFAKWNLTVTAAVAGGCAIIVFILTFAVNGGSGVARPFPEWWGNNLNGNVDRCLYVNTSD